MNFKKNYIYFINLALILLILIGDILYMTLDLAKLEHTLCKGITSALFVLLGLINLIYTFKREEINKKFSIIILLGLFFAMLGDIVLEINFMIGAILFAIGHIFFFVSYCFILPFKVMDLLIGIAIFVPAVLFITLAPLFNFGGVLMEVICVFYAVIISCMLGKAISNLIREKSKTNIVIFVGSLLFFFSDLMLLFEVFGKGGEVFSYLCLSTYYPAEILLALSILAIFIFKKTSVKNKNKTVDLQNNSSENKAK